MTGLLRSQLLLGMCSGLARLQRRLFLPSHRVTEEVLAVPAVRPTRDWSSGGRSSFRGEFGAVRKCAPGHHWPGPTVSGGAWKVDPAKKKGCFSLSSSLCPVWHGVLIDLRGRL